MDLTLLGKMSDLQDDMSPLQIGTTGTFDGKQFELIGRMRIGYPDGFWNEWYGLYGGDKECWLAEAQGFYAVCFADTEIEPPTLDKIRPGKQFDIDPDTFQVEDVRSVSCIYSEGELPLAAAQGRESVSVDLSAPGAKMATIEYAKKETRVFIGRYQDFDDFKFHNLRTIDGW